MRVTSRIPIILSILALVAISGCVIPDSPSPTIWRSLGIPQTWNTVGGHALNRRGGKPKRELKPPVKRLADPANLESEVPAIKKAAEIKQAEDMKQQKVKAVRYLAETAGCGCYDEGGEVTDALVAALDDCTEEVRFATVKALLARACNQQQCGTCPKCNGSCCNQKIIDKLSKLAYDCDDKGCWVEPSERIRVAAKAILQACCPTQTQEYYGEQKQLVIPPPVETPGGKKNLEGPDPEAETPGNDGMNMNDPLQTSVRNHYQSLPTFPIEGETVLKTVSYANNDDSSRSTTEKRREIILSGSVAEIAVDKNCLLIRLSETALVPVGTRLQVKRRQQLGRIDYLGEVEVIESEAGECVVTPVAPLSIHRINNGDSIMLAQ